MTSFLYFSIAVPWCTNSSLISTRLEMNSLPNTMPASGIFAKCVITASISKEPSSASLDISNIVLPKSCSVAPTLNKGLVCAVA